MENLKASIVIATYNRASDLERCLDSLMQQQGCEMEIIVVDDASPDNTCELVRSKYEGRVELVSREKNCGSIFNRNYGSSLAAGDVLFLIDDDTELPGPHTVQEVLAEFQNPQVGAVAIPYYQDGILKHCVPESASDEEYLLASYIGCASAVRRTSFLALGGYEEFFVHAAEEDDFCIRMLDAGQYCKIGSVSEPMVHYASPVRNYYKWDFYGRRNSLLYIWKNSPAAYVLPNLLVTTFRGVLHACRVKRLRGNFSGLFAGYGAILKCIAGKGCRRVPVRNGVYRVTLMLRKGPLPLSRVLSISGLAAE